MFGIINPPQAGQPSASVSSMLPAMMMNVSYTLYLPPPYFLYHFLQNSDMAAMGTYSSSQTMNNSLAANWGGNMDMSKMPEWSQSYMAQNVW
jgi:hypothetical protein